jgi:NADPH:quinone reductase-like Zn-dependent oxidoreductase
MKLRYKILSGIAIAVTVSITVLALVLSHNTACGPAPVVADGVETMKAVIYRCYGSPDVLEYVDVAKPTPAADEVLVKVVAASVNPLDWHYMRGEPYFMRLMGVGVGTPADSRMGVDFAGVVESVGGDVADFKPGDEVFGGRSGAFAEFVIVPENRAIAMKPANMSFKQAASVGIAGVTAVQALRDHGKLQPGQKVLINGASGGVGTFAVQVAKAMGAEVSGVCSTRNVEMVLGLGADHVFDYKKESYLDSGEQYDLIVDMVGNHSLLSNRKVLTPDGSFVIVGGAAGKWLGPMTRPIMAALMSPFVDQKFAMILATLNKDDLNELGELMRTGKVTPVLDQSFGIHSVPEAISYSEAGHARGKIIIEL